MSRRKPQDSTRTIAALALALVDGRLTPDHASKAFTEVLRARAEHHKGAPFRDAVDEVLERLAAEIAPGQADREESPEITP